MRRRKIGEVAGYKCTRLSLMGYLHNFDEEQDPDKNPHQSERSDPDLHRSESRIRIRIK
jgi:hypothetical protein